LLWSKQKQQLNGFLHGAVYYSSRVLLEKNIGGLPVGA